VANERHEFAHILVDEYQDLNRAEQGVIDLLGGNADICIVGDDDQSIYSFKHAHPEGIRDWLILNAGADDRTLEECRRCPTSVVEMANHLIAQNVNRPVPRALLARPENGPGDVGSCSTRPSITKSQVLFTLVEGLIAGGHTPVKF